MMKKPIKQYCVFPEHIEACNFTKEEYENLWDEQEEYPNRDNEDSFEDNFYSFECLFDTNDGGLSTGECTEKYLLCIYDESTLDKYPLVKCLVDTNPPEFDIYVYGKRHMTEKEIRDSINLNRRSLN